MELDRREFAALSAAAMVALPATGRAATSNAAPWHQRIKRVLHINFNELDPLDMDVEAYADLLAASHAQMTFLSVTGSVSYYPSAVPDFYPAAGLKGRDLFASA